MYKVKSICPLKSAKTILYLFMGLPLFFPTLAFSGDGRPDIVWQHSTGQVHYWPMDNGQPKQSGGKNINVPVSSAWHAVGVGDMDLDGTADIVWQHDNGQVHYWPMKDGQAQSGININVPVSRAWHPVGVGDVDGDRTVDIVWQHDNGQVHYWPMKNGQAQSGINIDVPVSPAWHPVGVGDVDGDGTADIVWQHDNGQVHYWPMKSGQAQRGINIDVPVSRAEWRPAGVGDVNGDRTADIIWGRDYHGPFVRNATQYHFWPMKEGKNQGGKDMGTPKSAGLPDPVRNEWHLIGVGDVGS